jgi:hypothetical protein
VLALNTTELANILIRLRVVKLPETWLLESDMERIWRVVHGELPESFCSEDEVQEFLRVTYIIGAQKLGAPIVTTVTLQ